MRKKKVPDEVREIETLAPSSPELPVQQEQAAVVERPRRVVRAKRSVVAREVKVPEPAARFASGVRSKHMILAAAIVLVLLVGSARAFHWWGWGLSAQELQNQKVAAILEQVGNLMLLPTNETPLVAAVTDAPTLKASQAFYKDAQNGDVLIVYSQAQRAILFRPSTDKLVNVGPIYVNGQSTTSLQRK